MTVSEPGSSEVLVVGAGPTGLLLACELLRHGLSVRIIDRGQGPTPWSRAQVLQTRTLEILEYMGLIGPFLERGRALRMLSMYDREMTRLFHICVGELDSTYPFMLSLPQREVEQLLIERLKNLGGVIEYGVRFLELTQDDGGVFAQVQFAGRKEVESLRTAWLVGCDGTHSAVRKSLALPFPGDTLPQRVIQADLRIDWRLPHGDDEIVGCVSEHGYLGVFPLPGERRYRLMAFDAGLAPTLENFQTLLELRGPAGARASDPAWMVEHTIDCRMAPKFRVGRVFLAGDAAHTHSPATGQGMNTGMQDAFNLAWKLALVNQGRGRACLLDSYEQERAPVAAALLERTEQATERLHSLLTCYRPITQVMRNYLLQFITELGLVQRRVSRDLSMLDVGYRQSPIVEQRHSTHSSQAAEEERAVSLREWLDFGNGPRSGERAFDGPVLTTAGIERSRLCELLGGPQHVLLLFGGITETAQGYARLVQIGEYIAALYSDVMRVYLVQVHPHPIDPPSVPWKGPLLFDREGFLHQIYGARGECLYLIRPDGYVGFRCQPADPQTFAEYMVRIFRTAAQA